MGEHSTKLSGLSFAPHLGFGFITDGKLLDFHSPFPHGVTRLVGGEIALDFQRLEAGLPPRPVGQLAFLYYWGHVTDHIDQSDLPFGDDPLLSLLQFSSDRESNSHYVLGEWRWPSTAPLFQNKRWTFIQPQFGLGVGGFYLSTKIQEENSGPQAVQTGGFLVTGSTQAEVVGFSRGGWKFSLEASVRMFAGQAFGMLGESVLRVGYHWR